MGCQLYLVNSQTQSSCLCSEKFGPNNTVLTAFRKSDGASAVTLGTAQIEDAVILSCFKLVQRFCLLLHVLAVIFFCTLLS